jgi:O-acetyl-ADP-ribose deacetylase (regulator of RNase III)
MPIAYICGDIFASQAQTLVNPVNCHGVMGAGLAREFARRDPTMFAEYRALCASGQLRPGVPQVYTGAVPWVLNFPTKDHWRSPSRLTYIERGLACFADHYAAWGITSIAFPRLGCGLGGLDWAAVEPVMRRWLDPLPIGIEIVVEGGDDVADLSATGQAG